MTIEQALENKKNRIKSNNSINILYPYKEGDTWYYDDPDIGVYKEAFVLGSSETIDRVLGQGEGIYMINWLCAEVLAYFPDYPQTIYVKFENI